MGNDRIFLDLQRRITGRTMMNTYIKRPLSYAPEPDWWPVLKKIKQIVNERNGPRA